VIPHTLKERRIAEEQKQWNEILDTAQDHDDPIVTVAERIRILGYS
jgi:hypothetical protein